MMASEADIRAALDGTFTTFDHDHGKVRTLAVPKSYLPHFGGKFAPADGNEHGLRRKWSASEDNGILEMRSSGKTWQEIATAFRASTTTVSDRYRLICKARGLVAADSFVARRAKTANVGKEVG